jgi:gas vesicle protein
MKKEPKINVNVGKVTAIAGAAIAAAAGAYFLYGTKQGKKVQKKVKSWALKAKAEVLEKLEKAKDVSEDSYNNIVSTVMSKYEKLKAEHGPEVEAVKKELMNYWKSLKNHGAPKKKASKKKATKATK